MHIITDEVKKVITVDLTPTKKDVLLMVGIVLLLKALKPKTFKFVTTKQIVTQVDKATYIVTNIDKYIK